MENHCAVDNEASTGALVVFNYTKKSAKNKGIDGLFEREQQCTMHTLL